jgi:hypothetical protein
VDTSNSVGPCSWTVEILLLKELTMAITNSWSSLQKAADKYGVERNLILKWVADGLVRSEGPGKKVVRVNLDDIDRKVQEMTGI